MLIDNRFDNVRDWKKVENNSRRPRIKRNISKLDKKINNQRLKKIIPNKNKYNIKLIKTAIKPKI